MKNEEVERADNLSHRKNRSRRGIGMRRKTAFSIFAVLIAATLIASAGLLTYYGKIETNVTVEQSVRLDGMTYDSAGNGYDDITIDNDIGTLVAGNCVWSTVCHDLHLHSLACDSVSTKVSSIVSPTDGGLTTMIAAEVQNVGPIPEDYTVPTGDVTVDNWADLVTEVTDGTAKTIIVKDGDYTGNGVLDVTDGDTIVAESKHGATFDGININSDGVTIKGFKTDGVHITNSYSDITITHCYIDTGHVSGTGVWADWTYTNHRNLEITHNEIHDIMYGMALFNTDNSVISHNEFYSMGDLGIQLTAWDIALDSSGPLPSGNTIEHNYFESGTNQDIYVQAKDTMIQYNDATSGSAHAIAFATEMEGFTDDFTSQMTENEVHYNNVCGTVYDIAFGKHVGMAPGTFVPDGGTVNIDASENWYCCDGMQVTDHITATWNTWVHDDTITLNPAETVHFMIQYCTEDGAVGDYTSIVKFLPTS